MDSRQQRPDETSRPWTEAEWEVFLRRHEPAAPVELTPADAPLLRQLGVGEPAGSQNTDREDFGDEANAQIRYIPAFRLARHFARAVEVERSGAAAHSPLWAELSREALTIAEHIASGHGLGYEDSHICGNIVKCRDALGHVERTISLLERVRGGDRELDHLLGTAVFMRLALEDRIRALRDRVWWDDRGATH